MYYTYQLATDEDKSYGIDKWSSLFKAISWEEIRMCSKNNESLVKKKIEDLTARLLLLG